MRVSKYKQQGKERLIEVISQATSLRDVILAYGLSPNGQGGYVHLRKICEEWGIDLTDLKKKSARKNVVNLHQHTVKDQEAVLSSYFIRGSTLQRHHIKKYCLRFHLIPYECSCCKNAGVWQGKDLVLQLEHKNGINNDNRIENLEFLCPNCHSQTRTFAGKNKGERHENV